MAATRVLVVDNSIIMRALFSNVLERGKDIVVVGAAKCADEAREMIATLKPDVLTLDVEMPRKNGLEFLEELMSTRPIPVIMLSTLTQKGADVSLRALEIGAVDCFAKPSRATPDEFENIADKLCKLVVTAAKSNLRAKRAPAKAAAMSATAVEYCWDGSLTVISGGMGAIEASMELLAAMPANCPPTILLLDIDEGLAVPFAAKLAAVIRPKVLAAADGAELKQGVVHVVTESSRHVVLDRWPGGHIRFVEHEPIKGHRPSADLLLSTAARVGGAKVFAVILSGAGVDGVAGLAAVATAGGMALTQSVSSALIAETIEACVARTPNIRMMELAGLADVITSRAKLQCAA